MTRRLPAGPMVAAEMATALPPVRPSIVFLASAVLGLIARRATAGERS